MNNKTEFKFGDYAIIEQKRHGVPNDMFVHKVIDQLRSNTWVDVPVQSPATETMHDEMEDVCLCICCGIDETEVRRYRVKDMRRHSPVSAVTDEKKGSTITLQAVNELIASLESAGELSIKEAKVMALAKAFKQLAAENVALSKDAQRYRFIRERDMFGSDNESGLLSWEELAELECNEFDDALDARINHPNTGFIELDAKMQARKTPATDAYRAGIKADGVEEFAKYQRAITKEWACKAGHSSLLKVAESAELFAKQLREGADKC